MQRGEVRWYPFASPDKKRPVLILTLLRPLILPAPLLCGSHPPG